MESQVLHTVWCNTPVEAAGEIWIWSLLAVKGLIPPRAVKNKNVCHSIENTISVPDWYIHGLCYHQHRDSGSRHHLHQYCLGPVQWPSELQVLQLLQALLSHQLLYCKERCRNWLLHSDLGCRGILHWPGIVHLLLQCCMLCWSQQSTCSCCKSDPVHLTLHSHVQKLHSPNLLEIHVICFVVR